MNRTGAIKWCRTSRRLRCGRSSSKKWRTRSRGSETCLSWPTRSSQSNLQIKMSTRRSGRNVRTVWTRDIRLKRHTNLDNTKNTCVKNRRKSDWKICTAASRLNDSTTTKCGMTIKLFKIHSLRTGTTNAWKWRRRESSRWSSACRRRWMRRSRPLPNWKKPSSKIKSKKPSAQSNN